MNEEEMIKQLKSLIYDRKSFISNNNEINEVFKKDIQALEQSIEMIIPKVDYSRFSNKQQETSTCYEDIYISILLH